MAVQPEITVNVPPGVGTYKIFRGSGVSPYPTNYAEVHFYPALGAEVEWNYWESITVTYKDGRQSDHYENLTRWNGFTWMVQEDNCPLAMYILGSSGSNVSSYKIVITVYGTANAFQYKLHDAGMGNVDWLYKDTTYKWNYDSQTGSYTRTNEVQSRQIEVRMTGEHPYVPGRRTDMNFYGDMYGVCLCGLWNNSGPEPAEIRSYGPTTTYREASTNDYWYHSGTYDYSYKTNMIHLYWWRPWILVSCDCTYNARWDEKYDYDPVHYPGCPGPSCHPNPLTCYLDLSTYGQGGSLPTPHWQGFELCSNPNYPDAIWYDRSSLTSTRAHPIYADSNLSSTSDTMIYCGWRDLSSEIEVYCYAPSESKYIDFRSGDYPAHYPSPETGASIYYYSSGSKACILSGPYGSDGWYYKYKVSNARRQYFYAYGSRQDNQYQYLSVGTDNGNQFKTGVTPYESQGDYFFYSDGRPHTIVFRYKKNKGFTYLPMYYTSNNTLIRGVRTNLPIRDGDA